MIVSNNNTKKKRFIKKLTSTKLTNFYSSPIIDVLAPWFSVWTNLRHFSIESKISLVFNLDTVEIKNYPIWNISQEISILEKLKICFYSTFVKFSFSIFYIRQFVIAIMWRPSRKTKYKRWQNEITPLEKSEILVT